MLWILLNKLKDLSNNPYGNSEQSAFMALKFASQKTKDQTKIKNESKSLDIKDTEQIKTSAEMTNQKYLDNLISVLDVVKGYDNLYSDEEKQMIDEFLSMELIGKVLIARMFFRK